MGDPLTQQPVKTLTTTDLQTAIYDAAGVNSLSPTASGHLFSDQGIAAALSGAWPVEVTDGTNVLGTSAHPFRVDPTGTTTQPVSGTVTANQGTAAALGGAWPVEVTDGTNILFTTAHRGNVATLADNTAGSAITTTGFAVGGTDGTNFRILSTDSTGRLNVNTGSAGTPVDTGSLVQTSLAAGASHTFSLTAVTNAKTGYLKHFGYSSSAPIKAVISKNIATVVTDLRTRFTAAADPQGDLDFDDNELSIAGNGTDFWQITITNQDNNHAANVYTDASWVEV